MSHDGNYPASKRAEAADGANDSDASGGNLGAPSSADVGAAVDGGAVRGRPLTQREQLAFLKKRGFISARQEKKLRKALQRQREAIDRESRRLLTLQAEVLGLKF